MTFDLPDDLREFYYSAEAGVCVLDTIELRHPSFLAEDGVTPEAVRIVNNPEDIIARLENNAPMNAGQLVTFKRGLFQASHPKLSRNGLPTFGLSAENVTRLLMPYLIRAAASSDEIELTARRYRSDRLTHGPGEIHGGLTFRKARAGVMRVSGEAGYEDFINMPHPARVYTLKEFPGLAN